MPLLKLHFRWICCGLIMGLLGSGLPHAQAPTNDVGPAVSTHAVVHEASLVLDSHSDRVVMKPDETPEGSRVQHELPAPSPVTPAAVHSTAPVAVISHAPIATPLVTDPAQHTATAASKNEPYGGTESSPQFLLSVNLVDQEPTVTGDVYLVKVTLLREQLGQQLAAAPMLLWEHDSGISTLMLRPFDERSWISRIEPGQVKGKQQLDLVVYWTSATGAHRMTTQSYHFDVRDQILTRIDTEVFGPATQDHATLAPGEETTAAHEPGQGLHEVSEALHAQVSLPMVGLHVLWLNLFIAFAAGLAFACYHHLPQAWIDRLSGEHHQVKARGVAVTQLRRMQSTAAAAETNSSATAAQADASASTSDAPPEKQTKSEPAPANRAEAALAALATVNVTQRDEAVVEQNTVPLEPVAVAEPAAAPIDAEAESAPPVESRPLDIGTQPIAMTDLLAQLKAAGIGSGAPAGSPLAEATAPVAASVKPATTEAAAPETPEPAAASLTAAELSTQAAEPPPETAPAEAASSDDADFEAMAAAMMGAPATPTSSGGYLVFGDEGADEMSEEELAALGHPVPVAQNPLSNTQLEDLLAEARTQNDIGTQSTIIEAEPPAQPPFIDSDEIDALLRTYAPQGEQPQTLEPETEPADEPPPLNPTAVAEDAHIEPLLPAGTPAPEASAADNLLASLKKLLPRAQNPPPATEPAAGATQADLPEPALVGVGSAAGNLEATEDLPEPLQTLKPSSEPALLRPSDSDDDDDLTLDFNDLSF